MGQVYSGSHKNCGQFTQVEHFPPEFASIKAQDAWSAGLSLLGTYLHWLTYFHEFAGFCWQQISWTSLLYLIYPSTTLPSDQNVSCRQSLLNSFLKNFAIFTDNMAATNSKSGTATYFSGVTLAFPIMELKCIAPTQLTILIKITWPYLPLRHQRSGEPKVSLAFLTHRIYNIWLLHKCPAFVKYYTMSVIL